MSTSEESSLLHWLWCGTIFRGVSTFYTAFSSNSFLTNVCRGLVKETLSLFSKELIMIIMFPDQDNKSNVLMWSKVCAGLQGSLCEIGVSWAQDFFPRTPPTMGKAPSWATSSHPLQELWETGGSIWAQSYCLEK